MKVQVFLRVLGSLGLWSVHEGSLPAASLLALTRSETVYRGTPSSELRAIAPHRFDRVVVRGLRRKVHHRDAVDHVREILIPSVERFCPAAEILRVRAVVHYRVLDCAGASISRPSDNGGIMRHRFQCGSLDDLHARSFLTSRTLLGSSLAREHQDTERRK